MPARAPRRAVPSLILAFAVGLVPILAACGLIPPMASNPAAVVGSGDVQTEARQLAAFTRISVGAGLKVIIGAATEQSVSVAAQAQILPAIKTEVVDGQLIVTIPAPGVATSQPMSLTVKLPALESIALSAGAIGYVEHTGHKLNVDVSGAAQLTAIGDTPDLTLTASSGSHAKLGELTAQNAQVTIKDGSSSELTVTTRVSGTVDGGATLVLTSKPAQVAVETSSGGTVQGGS